MPIGHRYTMLSLVSLLGRGILGLLDIGGRLFGRALRGWSICIGLVDLGLTDFSRGANLLSRDWSWLTGGLWLLWIFNILYSCLTILNSLLETLELCLLCHHLHLHLLQHKHHLLHACRRLSVHRRQHCRLSLISAWCASARPLIVLLQLS